MSLEFYKYPIINQSLSSYIILSKAYSVLCMFLLIKLISWNSSSHLILIKGT